MKLTFDPEQNEALFGDEQAEKEPDERFSLYFFKNKAFHMVRANVAIRILVAQKGKGKSAILRYCQEEDENNGIVNIRITSNDVEDIFRPTLNKVESTRIWKEFIVSKVFDKICEKYVAEKDVDRHLGGFNVSKAIITLFSSNKIKPIYDGVRKSFHGRQVIRIYIDDLDKGWEGRPEEVVRFSSLFSAVTDLTSTDRNLQFKIGVRSDVFRRIEGEEDTRDKIESNIIPLSWSNHEILCMFAYRITTFLGQNYSFEDLINKKQVEVGNLLYPVFEKRFQGSGARDNIPMHRLITTLIRQRPRDVILFAKKAANLSFQRDKDMIYSSEIKDILEDYSLSRINDVVVEHKTECPDIKRFLLEMKTTKSEMKKEKKNVFETSEIRAKIREVLNRVPLRFNSGEYPSVEAVHKFLFKIDFLTARLELDDGFIDRRYYDEGRKLDEFFGKGKWKWEVHPAYRWAIGYDTGLEKVFDDIQFTKV